MNFKNWKSWFLGINTKKKKKKFKLEKFERQEITAQFKERPRANILWRTGGRWTDPKQKEKVQTTTNNASNLQPGPLHT